MKHKYDDQHEREVILNAIRRIASLLGKTPTQKEYKINRTPNELTLEQISYRFSNYSSAVISAGLKPNENKVPPRQPEITKEELIEDFINVANKLGKIPTNTEFRVNSKYSWTPYKTRWGSFKNAIDYIVLNYRNKINFDVDNYSRIKKQINNKIKFLNYPCSLIYEPTNEYETIALFVVLSEALGYKIKRIQSDFPDAILINERNEEVYVEFEFLSSNYKQHCHPENFNGLCVCWRKDIELGNIQILSLEEYIKQ